MKVWKINRFLACGKIEGFPSFLASKVSKQMNMRFTVLAIVLLFAVSCTNQKKKNLTNREGLNQAFSLNEDTSLTESGKYFFENTKIEFGNPISFNSTQNIAIPIILEQKYVDKGIPRRSYFNIAIVDTSNTIKKMLFEESVIIDNLLTLEKQTDFQNLYNYDDEEFRVYSERYNSLIFFDLWMYKNRKRDYNRFFVYNLEKDELHQLSPDNCNVTGWNIFDNQSKIMIQYQFDSDQNGKFEKTDDENMIIIDPNSPQKSTGLFDLEKLKKIKLQVAKDNQVPK